MAQNRKKVLVLGAGYAGLQAVTKLQKEVSANEAEITLVNKNQINNFQNQNLSGFSRLTHAIIKRISLV